MKLSNNLIRDVVTEVAGERAVPIVMVLKDQPNFSEFKVAEALNMEIKEIRKALYKLLEYNLVSFRRKKDKKKGWYIYYWTFNPEVAKYLYSDIRIKKLEKLKERLAREQSNSFYICPNRCVRLDFERASDFEFHCPECGSLMDVQDNTATIEHLKSEIERLSSEIKKAKQN